MGIGRKERNKERKTSKVRKASFAVPVHAGLAELDGQLQMTTREQNGLLLSVRRSSPRRRRGRRVRSVDVPEREGSRQKADEVVHFGAELAVLNLAEVQPPRGGSSNEVLQHSLDGVLVGFQKVRFPLSCQKPLLEQVLVVLAARSFVAV